MVEPIAAGPTRAHAAHKALLGTWAVDDTRLAIPAAVAAIREGRPRPAMPFTGT